MAAPTFLTEEGEVWGYICFLVPENDQSFSVDLTRPESVRRGFCLSSGLPVVGLAAITEWSG